MSKLIIFGDSFADKVSTHIPEDKQAWFEILSKKLDRDLVSYGLNGTSISYSTSKLFEYLNSPQYHADDIIVFVTSALSRLPLVHSKIIPNYASKWLMYLNGELSKKDNAWQHFHQNHNFYKMYHQFFNYEQVKQQKISIALTLKALPNLTVILSAFEDVTEGLIDDRLDLLKNDTNFILINAKLFQISEAEFAPTGTTYVNFTDFFGGECRHCHLSNSNNQELADQLYNCITHQSNNYFNKDNFKKHFIPLDYTQTEILNNELLSLWGRGVKKYNV